MQKMQGQELALEETRNRKVIQTIFFTLSLEFLVFTFARLHWVI
jgi:hypothetical protein